MRDHVDAGDNRDFVRFDRQLQCAEDIRRCARTTADFAADGILRKGQKEEYDGRGYGDDGPDVPYEDVVERGRNDGFLEFRLIDGAAYDFCIGMLFCSLRSAKFSSETLGLTI